jgi:hypothetical protein
LVHPQEFILGQVIDDTENIAAISLVFIQNFRELFDLGSEEGSNFKAPEIEIKLTTGTILIWPIIIPNKFLWESKL